MAKLNPRSELIKDAALNMRNYGMSPHIALEAAVASGRTANIGTIAYAMLEYYRSTSDNALERLIKAAERAAQG